MNGSSHAHWCVTSCCYSTAGQRCSHFLHPMYCMQNLLEGFVIAHPSLAGAQAHPLSALKPLLIKLPLMVYADNWLFLTSADIVEVGLLERVDFTTRATETAAAAQQQQQLRGAVSALVLRLLAAPLVLDASTTVRCFNRSLSEDHQQP